MGLIMAGMEAHPSLEYWRPELTVGSLGDLPVGSNVGVPAGQQRSELAYGQCDSLFGQGHGTILHRWAAVEMLWSRLDTSASSVTGLINFLLRPGCIHKPVWIHQRFHWQPDKVPSSDWQTENPRLQATMWAASRFLRPSYLGDVR